MALLAFFFVACCYDIWTRADVNTDPCYGYRQSFFVRWISPHPAALRSCCYSHHPPINPKPPPNAICTHPACPLFYLHLSLPMYICIYTLPLLSRCLSILHRHAPPPFPPRSIASKPLGRFTNDRAKAGGDACSSKALRAGDRTARAGCRTARPPA